MILFNKDRMFNTEKHFQYYTVQLKFDSVVGKCWILVLLTERTSLKSTVLVGLGLNNTLLNIYPVTHLFNIKENIPYETDFHFKYWLFFIANWRHCLIFFKQPFNAQRLINVQRFYLMTLQMTLQYAQAWRYKINSLSKYMIKCLIFEAPNFEFGRISLPLITF